jgi:hypothetical protein
MMYLGICPLLAIVKAQQCISMIFPHKCKVQEHAANAPYRFIPNHTHSGMEH